jgi:hypothetical protein
VCLAWKANKTARGILGPAARLPAGPAPLPPLQQVTYIGVGLVQRVHKKLAYAASGLASKRHVKTFNNSLSTRAATTNISLHWVYTLLEKANVVGHGKVQMLRFRVVPRFVLCFKYWSYSKGWSY